MKTNLLSILPIFMAVFLLYSGFNALQQAFITNAIESRLDYFSSHSDPIVRPNDRKLGELDPNSLTTSAHLLNSFVLFNQWISYIQKKESASHHWVSLLNASSDIRPTWSETYVELAKLSTTPQQADEYQQLAMKFGPYSLSSRLLVIDNTFTRWNSHTLDNRVNASRHLVSVARSWRYRDSLNQMIEHSKGKQRICNLLGFNKLKVQACE